MSDKSFGDHTNRNIVKNPLLSSAVTGLSLEDLTHKAVLLPVTPSLGQITRPDQQQGSQTRALAHADHETPTSPSGDTFSNTPLSNITQTTDPNIVGSHNNEKLEKNRGTLGVTHSKASLKTDDDFDVNEYIARLQGSRYVSAPLHSHLKEDKNANLEATEETLEEINLNESQGHVEVQQSLTADIAHNFSQLPTVLPHVASAVFSSFSNMLSYKSREQTPDRANVTPDQRGNKGYDDVQFQRPDVGVPMVGMEDCGPPKEVAAPPKEPPIGGAGNFRIATKKKYAQIPGLSSGEPAQTMTFNAPGQNMPAIGQNMPYMGQNMPPSAGQSMAPIGQNMPPSSGQSIAPIGQSMPPPLGQSMPPIGQNMPPPSGQNMAPIGQNMPPAAGQSKVPVGQNMPPPSGQNMAPKGQNMPPPSGQSMPPIGQNMPPSAGHSKVLVGQNMPPSAGQSMAPVGQNMPSAGQSMAPIGQNMAPPSGPNTVPIGQNMPPRTGWNVSPIERNFPPVGQNMPPFAPVIAPIGQNMPPFAPNISALSYNMPPFVPSVAPIGHNVAPIGQNVPSFFNPHEARMVEPHASTVEAVKRDESNVNTQQSQQHHIFNPIATEKGDVKEFVSVSEQPNTFGITKDCQQNFFSPIEHKDQATQNIPPNPNIPGAAAIIPPPPMFSNLTRRDSQTAIGKSILPPSVARRISGNQPIIKPAVSTPSFSENIFVPASVSETSSENSGHADNRFPPGLPAFVPGYTTPNKMDQISPSSDTLASSQTNKPSTMPPAMSRASAPTYFIPSNEIPQTSTEVPKFYSPPELAPPAATTFQMAPPSTGLITPVSKSTLIGTVDFSPMQGHFGTPPFLPPTSTFSEPKISPVTTIFTPRELESVPQPPTFLNPLEHEETPSANAPHPITQYPPMANPEPPKPVPDPPKASGNVNFRMTKKRPQYYAGPIEGVGAISNNVKPVFAPIIPSATSAEASQFQGALFTPEQPIQPAVEPFSAPNIEQASIPFDISRPVDKVIPQTPFDISKPQEQSYGLPLNFSQPENQSYGLEFDTAFDMSRSTTETYEPPKQESRGFGIIGSLKSKLSSIDINKIQSSVTTFFDPAYKDYKIIGSVAQDNTPYRQQQYEHQQFGQSPQEQASFNIGSNVEQSQYSQYKHAGYNNNPNNQYYQAQDPYAQNQGQNYYPPAGSFTDQGYKSEQVYTASPLYDINKENLPTATKALHNIPVGTSTDVSKSIGNVYHSNVFNQDMPPTYVEEQPSNNPELFLTQQKIQAFPVATDKTPDISLFYNPNSFVEDKRRNSQPSLDASKNFCQSTADPNTRIMPSVFSSEKSLEPTFYDPNAFTSESQVINTEPINVYRSDFQQKSYHMNEDLTAKIHKTTTGQEDSLPICDSALNTSKYNMSGIQKTGVQQNVTPRIPLAPGASFFDNPQSINQPQITKADDGEDVKLENVEEQFESKNIEINKMLADTPIPSITKTRDDSHNNVIELDPEKLLREKNLVESISRDVIPILGVSTVPLFGLSAIIAERSREISESENKTKNISIFETAPSSRSLFEGNTGASFFENMASDSKLMNENQARKTPLDITGLSIDDVKNVLLIEPPQENIGALLKRNASSGKLESLTKTEEASHEHFRQQNDNLPSTAFQEKLHLKYDEKTSEIFFQHSTSEKEYKDLDKESSVESQDSELNICETCREVNTPDFLGPEHKETEYLTNQMIDNITSRMPLSNPLTVLLKETNASVDERSQFDDQQFDEITHIAEDTMETLQVQSATELLDEEITTGEVRNYGWTNEDAAYSAAAHVEHDYGFKVDTDASAHQEENYGFQTDANPAVSADNDYEFKLDPYAIGFFGNNSLFFDNLPKNASDEKKAEIQSSQEDIALPRQISIPSAPPAEDDTKSDETGGLDVHSIEQDAKNDFPLEEEFVIEPSETDDDKIEFKEREKSSEETFEVHDTFTSRIERFKKEVDNPYENVTKGGDLFSSLPLPMASYFDTGNYAVESHYKNSLTSPTSVSNFHNQYNITRIPPGFEEEFARRLSGICLKAGDIRYGVQVPDTSTQTRQIITATYSRSDARENVIGTETRRQENVEAFVVGKGEPNSPNTAPDQAMSTPLVSAMPMPHFTGFISEENSVHATSRPITTEGSSPYDLLKDNLTGLVEQNPQPEIIPEVMQNLPDPRNFFSANVEADTPVTEAGAPQDFNRLASYFSMPPAQPEPAKPFFELSQGQNHYRHENKTLEDGKHIQRPYFELSQSQNHYIDDDAKNNIKKLIKDLTSPSNKIQENVVKTVNYFTVEYNNEINPNSNVAAPINLKINDAPNIVINDSPKIDNKSDDFKHILDGIEMTENERKYFEPIVNCKLCRNNLRGIHTKDFKVRTAVNETSEARTEEITTDKEKSGSKTIKMTSQNYDLEGQAQDGVAVLNEHRSASEYSPVEHHWFYRVDVEEKSVWRGFSLADSRRLEETFNSPELNESTLVATDGGRYDVNVVGRLRLAVYWKEKPTNVRRCSWFYKGTTDARYVPYTEAVAEKLEEEYRHGVTTGEWHRRLALPNSEMVIMHGPSVMVHFLHSGATDAFSTPPSVLGKRVYRSPPRIKVARDQKSTIDHLILLVHGAGEYKRYPYSDQATSRPRVVRRGHEESEIEETEPSRIDHLLLLCHGVGSACDMRFRPVEEVVEDFRATTLQLLQSHYRNSYENGVVSRVEVLPISWHAQLHSGENGVDRRLSRVTLDSIPRLRAFTNHTVLDVLFYTSPVFHQTIIDTVCSEVNRIYSMFKQRNPHFNGDVSLGGHSLGSVILYDLLCNQMSESAKPESPTQKTYVAGTTGSEQPNPQYPQLVFSPSALYALGSPIAIFECIRGVESLGMDFALPTCKNFFNIFHPYDPIAYRIEPLINPHLQVVKPSQIPHHKGRKRMHLELKDTMARVGADLKQKLVESLRTTWNKWKAVPPTDGQLEKVVEEEIEKEQLCDDPKEEVSDVQATPEMLGHLNEGRRIDYVLQEAPLEMINEYLFAMSSHVGYWESEDTMLLMLREIYSSLGVAPDCSVPQHSMSVQRTRSLRPQDEANAVNEKEFPSTSRGGT